MIYGRERAKLPVTAINTLTIPKIEMDDDGKWHYIHKTLIDWKKEEDKRMEHQIFKAVADYAIEHDIDTVYLIDEEFVKTALLNEIKRRNGNEN